MALVGALLGGGAALAATLVTIPTGAAAAATAAAGGSDAHAALRAATRGVQVMVLNASCGGACQADLIAAVTAAGCDQVRLFPTLRMASARCGGGGGGGVTPAAGGGGSGGPFSLAHLPGVQSAAADEVVTAIPSSGGVLANSSHDTPAARRRQSVPWGLDRINQAALPLDGSAHTRCYPARGAGVTVYVVDTGIHAAHAQFGGRARGVVAPGAALRSAADEYHQGRGHGSHVAGTVAGKTTGVAPAATVVGVRVFDAAGGGRLVDVVSAFEYVAAAKARRRGARVVLNASFGTRAGGGRVWTDAAARTAAAGVVVVVAAGNTPVSACAFHPAAAAGVLSVVAADQADRLARFSARGRRCVAAAAPGVRVVSVDAASRRGLMGQTGTSAAAAHVAGLAALVLAEDPVGGGVHGAEVLRRLTRHAPRVGPYPMAWADPSCA